MQKESSRIAMKKGSTLRDIMQVFFLAFVRIEQHEILQGGEEARRKTCCSFE